MEAKLMLEHKIAISVSLQRFQNLTENGSNHSKI